MALNQRGSMLTMTMIFVGTMASILFIASSMSTTASKDRLNETRGIQSDIFVSGVHSALMNQPQCQAVLGLTNYSGAKVNLSKISIVQGNPVVKGEAYAAGLKISSMSVMPNPALPMQLLIDGSRQYFANLRIVMDGGKDWVSRNSQVDIPIRVNTDTSNKVLSCAEETFFSASAGGIDRTCLNNKLDYKTTTEILGGMFNVYYMIRSKKSNLRYYCVTPQGESSGFMTACYDGKCLWDN